jgi:methylamine--corrinoid protein Co-methyltransferase
MVSLLEIADRARKGPKLSEDEWNLNLFKSMQNLSREFGLKDLGPDVYLDIDHDYADKAFDAAVRFIVEVGVFVIPFNRVLKFTEEEVKEAIRSAPGEVLIGAGRDARRIIKREIEDRRSVHVWSAMHSPYTEDLHHLAPKNYAMIQRMDMIDGFNSTHFDGYEVYSPPIEAYAAMREIAYMREGVRKAGRPGMAIHYYPINTTASTMIAPLDPERGLRRTDGVLVRSLPDIKIQVDMLTACMVYENYGCYRFIGGSSQIGAFCGGPAGAIIEAIVHTINGVLIYHGYLGTTGVGYIYAKSNADPRIQTRPAWPAAVVHHALCRNSRMIRFGGTQNWSGGAWGIGSAMHLRSIAVDSMTATVLGSGLGIRRAARPQPNEGQSPLEIEWSIDVSDATIKAGMGLQDVEEVMKTLNKRYTGTPIPKVKKKVVTEVYDLVRHRPFDVYQKVYEEVKKEYMDLGLAFD